MIKQFDKKNGELKRKISGIMAAVMVLTVAGTVTLVKTEEAAAKETLDSITKVINGLSKENPYKILEVVPDNVIFETELADCSGEIHVISGNQTMGFTGYYIAGQEPVRHDIDSMFNDKLEEENLIGGIRYIYTGSTVSDSNMRYELADKMFMKLNENGILLDSNRSPNPITRKKSRSILEAPLFDRDDKKHVDAYFEVREGEVGISGDILVTMENTGEIKQLIRDYDGTMKLKDETHAGESPVPFIDEAKGSMIASLSGNFIMTYDMSSMPVESKDIASDFVRGCLIDGIYESNTLKYVSALNSDGTVDQDILNARIGDFDPKLDYVDLIYKEENNVSANTTAIFSAVTDKDKSASYGYIVTGWKIADNDNIPTEGTPLYTFNGDHYIYAGRYGSIPGFTLSGGNVTDNSVTDNSVSDNSVSDNSVSDNTTAHVETHLNKFALSSDLTGGDIVLKELHNEELIDDAPLTEDNTSRNSNEILTKDKEPQNFDEITNDGEVIQDGKGLLRNADIPSVDTSLDSNEDEPGQNNETDTNLTYYMLSFGYTTVDNPTYTYYTVVDFAASDEESGGEYYVNLDKAEIVNSALGKGCIGLGNVPKSEDLKYFVFDYVKKNGTYSWKPADYASSAYVDAPVYRIRGSKIYYGYKFVNNDWFKKFVFDREDNECAGLPVEVSTQRVIDITEKTVSNNNMVIVLGGDSSLCLGEEYNDYSRGSSTIQGNDFSASVYKSLIRRIAQDKIPVVGDYKVVEAAEQNKPVRGSFVHYLIRVLMLKIKTSRIEDTMDADPGFMAYYNSINGLDISIDGNRFEPKDTSEVQIINDSMQHNGYHFVNGNAYVYNLKHGNQNVYQKFLNPYLCTMADIKEPLPENNESPVGFSDTEVNQGFKEVLNDIKSENNFRKADTVSANDPKLLFESVTEATALRYIIGYSQKRTRNTKGTLRVLEIEPTNSFDLYIDDNEEDSQGNIKAYNSYGMWGHSYTAKRGFEMGSMEKLDNNNWILFRNGTYKRTEKTSNGSSNAGSGIVYRRRSWNESGEVALRENVYERNRWNQWNLDRNKETARNFYRSTNNKFIEFGNNIELTRMSVAEFIGHIEDLNSDYDVIYIGMNTQLLNVLNGDTVYIDQNMNGMVYTSIGDRRRIWPVLASYESLITSGTDDDEHSERYSGNDINDEFVKKLTQFVDAGYPIILDDGFFVDASATKDSRKINTKHVDTVSYMYQFVNNVKDRRSVYSVSDVYNENTSSASDESFFNWLLKLNKPEIVIKKAIPPSDPYPMEEAVKELDPDSQELSSTNFVMYGYELTQDPFDGQFHLPFEFSIRNLGAASSDSSYSAKLYVDLNADGKYSESREKIDFTTLREDGYAISSSGDNLCIGKEYYAQCELPGAYDGVVPWRLVVSQMDHPERRTNVTGYYRLKKDTPAEINVLQLNQRQTRDLQPEDQGSDSTWNMQETSTAGTFKDLLDAISKYYKVNITTMDADEWERKVAVDDNHTTIDALDTNKYYEDLRKYNMLILGFADAYLGPKSENATAAIEKYIKSERSTMFTHDCTSFFNYDYFTHTSGWEGTDEKFGGQPVSTASPKGYIYHWGYYFNKHIRNVVGMDRFNVMNGESSEYHKYDIAYEPGSGVRIGEPGNSVVTEEPTILNSNRGISSRDITSHTYLNPSNPYYEESNNATRYYNLKGINDGNGQDGGGSWETTDINGNVVTQVNDGQITKFPFALHKSFPVAPTHSQYYQLDFNDDADKDGEKDIVVWYCISDAPNRSFDGNITGDNWVWGGDMYEMSPNDVRNNYYIYNKGSITYSGVGHWKVVDDTGADKGNPSLKKHGKVTTGRYSMVDDKGLTDNTDELKLFINTMVAAYQRGIREPSLKVVRSYTDRAATGSLYLSYDKEVSSNGILDSDVELYFTAARSNIGNTDDKIKDNLKIRLYYEASKEEADADPNDNIVELDPMSREYDVENGSRYYYDDGNNSGIYGIEIPVTGGLGVLSAIKSVEYWNDGVGRSLAHEYKNDDYSKGSLDPDYNKNEYLADNCIYKITFGGVNEVKAEGSEDLWYNYNDGYNPSVSANTIQERSLNNRRIILMITDDNYNERSNIGREESVIQYMTLTRAKMFMLD